MSDVVGSVNASFRGDASGLTKAAADAISALDKARQKAADLNAVLKDGKVAGSLTAEGLASLKAQAQAAEAQVSKLVGAQNAAATSIQQVGKQMNAAKAGVSSAMSAISSLGGETNKLGTVAMGAGQGLMGMADALKSGGIGAAAASGALAAVVLGVQLLNQYIAEQDALAKKLDETWTNVTKKGVELRNAATAAVTSSLQQKDLNLQLAGAGTNSEAERIKIVNGALLEQKKIETEIAITRAAMLTTIQQMKGASDETRGILGAQLQALTASKDAMLVAKGEQQKLVDGATDFVAAQEKATKAAEARAKAEQNAKDSLQFSKQQLKEMMEMASVTGDYLAAAAARMGGMAAYGAAIGAAINHAASGNQLPSALGQDSAAGHRTPEIDAAGIAEINKWFLGADDDGPVISLDWEAEGYPKKLEEGGRRAGFQFNTEAVGGLISSLGSGDIKGLFVSLGGALGTAAGIPFAGEMLSAAVGLAEIIADGIMKTIEMGLQTIGDVLNAAGYGNLAARGGNNVGVAGGAAVAGGLLGAGIGTIFPVPYLGTAVGGAIGAAAGGAVGGAAGGADFISAISQMTPEFQKFVSVLKVGLDRLVAPFGQIWKALTPLAGAFVQLATAIVPFLSGFIQMGIIMLDVSPIIEIFMYAMKMVAWLFVSFSLALNDITYIFYKMLETVGAISDEEWVAIRDSLNKQYDGLEKLYNDINNITVSSGRDTVANLTAYQGFGQMGNSQDINSWAGKLGEFGDGLDSASAKLDGFGETLTNIPSGYKRRLAGLQWEATEAQDGPGQMGSAGAVSSGGAVNPQYTINIASWNSTNNLASDMRNIANLASRGNMYSQLSRAFNPDDRN